MGLSNYESWRDLARKATQDSSELAILRSDAETSAQDALEAYRADDPRFNGDVEDPYADLEESGEYRRHPDQDDPFWGEADGEYERELFQDAAEDYQRFGGPGALTLRSPPRSAGRLRRS